MTAPRIDSLSPGDRIVLQFPAGIGHATFILHSGEGEDRTATFSQPGADGPELWDAYRHKKRWCYGSAQTPLKVLGRALPPPAPTVEEVALGLLDGRISGDFLHAENPLGEEPEFADRNFTPEQQAAAERIADDPRVHISPAYTPPPIEIPLSEPLTFELADNALQHRPFNAPNPTCACGNDATVIVDPENLPNLAVCTECAEAIKDGA